MNITTQNLKHRKKESLLKFSKYEYNFFQFFVKMFIISRTTPRILTYSTILINAIITFCALVKFQNIFELNPLKPSITANYIIYIFFVLMITYIIGTLLFTIFGISVVRENSPLKKYSIKFLSLLNDFYTFVIPPGMVLAVSYVSETTPLMIKIFFMLILIASLALNFLIVLFGRNNFRTNNCLSSLDSTKELIISIIFLIMMFLKNNLKLKEEEEFYFLIIENFVFFILLIILCSSYLFWDPEINLLMKNSYGIIFLSKLYSEELLFRRLNLTDNHYLKISLLMIACVMICRINKNINERFPYIDFLDPKNKNFIRIRYALLSYQRLEGKNHSEEEDLSQEEMRLYLFYEGIMKQHMDQCPKINCFCFQKRKGKPLQKTLELFLKEKKHLNFDFYKMYLEIQLVGFSSYLFTFRNSLLQLSQKANSIVERYYVFHIQKLFNSSLNCIYEKKTEGVRITDSLNSMYKDLFALSQAESPIDTLDIKYILSIQSKYKKLALKILKILKLTVENFVKIENRNEVDTRTLYKFNKKIFEKSKEIKKSADEILDDRVPSYLLALLTFYFSCVKNELKLGKRIFSLFKSKLKEWTAMNFHLHEIENKNIFLNSVVFRVSIDSFSKGEILDFSTDYYNYLGEGIETNLKGTNINDILPLPFRKKHEKMMKKSENVIKVLNRFTETYVMGFDGFMRKVKFTLSICPYLADHISAFAYIRFVDISENCFVLVDKKFDIFLGNKRFWDIVDAMKETDKEITNVNDITEEITSDLAKIKNFKNTIFHLEQKIKKIKREQKKMQDLENSHRMSIDMETEKISRKSSIQSVDKLTKQMNNYQHKMSEFIKLTNEGRGKQYWISEESPLYLKMNDYPISLKVKPLKFGPIDFFSLEIGFDGSYFEKKSEISSSIHSNKSNLMQEDIDDWLENIRGERHKRSSRRSVIEQLPLHKWWMEENVNDRDIKFKDLEKSTVNDYNLPSSLRFKAGNQIQPTGSGEAEEKETLQVFDQDIPKSGKKYSLGTIPELSREGLASSRFLPTLEANRKRTVEKKINGRKIIGKKNNKGKKRKNSLGTITRKNILIKKKRLGFADIVTMKLKKDRDYRRKLQRKEDQKSVLLASSIYLVKIIMAIRRSREKQRRQISHRNNEEGSISTQGFNSKLNKNYFIDSVLNGKKNVKHQNIFLLNFLTFLFVFLSSVGYIFMDIYPIYEKNLNEFKIVNDLTKFKISLGYNLLDNIEYSSFKLANDKSNYNEILEENTEIILKNFCDFSLERAKEAFDELITDFITLEGIDRERIVEKFFDNSMTVTVLEEGRLKNFKTNEMFIISNYLSLSTELIGVLDNFSEKLTQSEKKYSKQILKKKLITSILNGFQIIESTYDCLLELENLILTELFQSYKKRINFFFLYYLTGIISSFFLFLYIISKTQKSFLSSISSYFCLTSQEIEFQLKIYERFTNLLQTQKFNEPKLITEFIQQEAIIEECSEKKKNLKNQHNRISNKFNHRNMKLFPSVIKVGIFGATVSLWFLLYTLIIYSYDSFQNKNIELEKIAFGTIQGSILHSKAFLVLIIESLYSDALEVNHEKITNFEFGSNLKFINQYQESETHIAENLGSVYQKRIKEITLGDICKKLESTENEKICSEMNSAIMGEGLINFFYYQNGMMKSVKQKLEKLGERKFEFGSDDIFEEKGFNEVWNTKDFIELRLGYMASGDYFILKILSILKESQENIGDDMRSLNDSLFIGYNTSVAIFLGIFMLYAILNFKQDQQIVKETFRIIHPKIILDNAYVLNKFKIYSGVKFNHRI